MHALSRPARSRTSAVVIHPARIFLLAVAWSGRTLLAQSPVMSARTMMETGPSASCAPAMSGDVGVSWDAVRLRLLSAPVTAIGRQSVDPIATIDVASSARRTWRVRASGAVGTSEPRCAAQSAWSRGWIGATRAIPRGGVALAFGLKSLSAVDPSRDREGVTMSAWQQFGGGRWDIDLRAFGSRGEGMNWFTRTVMRPDSVRADPRRDSTGSDTASAGWTRFFKPVQVPDSGRVALRSNQLALSTRWRRAIGRASLDLTFGGTGAVSRSSTSPLRDSSISQRTLASLPRVQLWARADTRVTLTRFADLLVGVAALPSNPESGVRAGRVASIGLAFSTGAREPRMAGTAAANSFEVHRIAAIAGADSTTSDSVTVRIRLRDDRARQIDVSGEQLGWRPVALTRVDAQWWEVEVRMRAGTYRMSVRRDGKRWTAPPGFPVLRDEFGGEVALVTVR